MRISKHRETQRDTQRKGDGGSAPRPRGPLGGAGFTSSYIIDDSFVGIWALICTLMGQLISGDC